MESLILREQQGFSGEFDELFFTGGASGVEDFGDMPVVVRAESVEVAVHEVVEAGDGGIEKHGLWARTLFNFRF
jgi:hypothetical protein